MSAWGYTDNAAIKGTVVISVANSTAVLGVSSEFTTNVQAGDYLTIAGNVYQVGTVTSNTVLTLTTPALSNSSGVVAYVKKGPKYLINDNTISNTYTIQRVYGVDLSEMNTSVVKSAAIFTAGAGYTTQARNNTTVVIATSGPVQPTNNATATLSYNSDNTVASITITSGGSAYVAGAVANTTITVRTTGPAQPTSNASANLTFTASTESANADHTGWVHFMHYRDAYGNYRRKSEVLVAMSKNFTAANAGDDEDVIFPD